MVRNGDFNMLNKTDKKFLKILANIYYKLSYSPIYAGFGLFLILVSKTYSSSNADFTFKYVRINFSFIINLDSIK